MFYLIFASRFTVSAVIKSNAFSSRHFTFIYRRLNSQRIGGVPAVGRILESVHPEDGVYEPPLVAGGDLKLDVVLSDTAFNVGNIRFVADTVEDAEHGDVTVEAPVLREAQVEGGGLVGFGRHYDPLAVQQPATESTVISPRDCVEYDGIFEEGRGGGCCLLFKLVPGI